jgi:hypothetical protein
MNATVYPANGIPRIVVMLYQDDAGAWWPKSASVGSLDNVPLDYLRSNFPPEPGWYWDQDSCVQATVKKMTS